MNRLKDLRTYKNLSQEQMGKMLNVSKVTICNYENEKYEMSTDILCKVAKFFNTSVDYILCNTNITIPNHLIRRNKRNRLKELRINNDKTQKDISDYLYISQNGYSDYETGKLDIPYNVLLSLCKYYKTSIDYLLYRTDIANPYSKINRFL